MSGVIEQPCNFDSMKKCHIFSKSPDSALYLFICLLFFFLPIVTTPAVIAGIISIALWLYTGCNFSSSKNWSFSVGIAVVLLALLPWVGLLWSHDPASGVKLAKKSYYWVFALMMASLDLNDEKILSYIKSYLAGLLVSVCIVMLQFVNILPLRKEYTYGLFNYISYSLMLVSGILLLAFFYKNMLGLNERKIIITIMLSFMFALLVLKGRSGYLAFIITLPWILFTMFGRSNLIRIIIAYIIILSILFCSPTVRERIGVIFSEISSYEQGKINKSQDSAVRLRFIMWEGGIQIFREHLLFGSGTGSYKMLQRQYNNNPDLPNFDHPHNSFIYMASSYGLVGLLLISWLFVKLTINGWMNRNSIAGYATLTFTAVIVIGSLTDTQVLSVHTGYLLALISGINMNPFLTTQTLVLD